MSDQPEHRIAFWRDRDKRRPYLVATDRATEDADAPIELIRPYSDGSGDEVLVSLSAGEWAELIAFVEEHGKVRPIEAKGAPA